MIILAAALTLGINLEIDLGALLSRQKRTAVEATCGIKIVGYHFTGKPGQQFDYANETFTIPNEGFVEVVALPKLATYSVGGEKLALDNGTPLDSFSMRWIALPLE